MQIIGVFLAFSSGVAFQVATKPTPVPPQPPRSCPNVLEMRYITHFSGLTPDDRKKMLEGIENYRRLFKEQLALEKDLLPNDPRSEKEKNNAQELLEKVIIYFLRLMPLKIFCVQSNEQTNIRFFFE